MSRSVLVIAAHPDDEVLGCGGTLARHVAEGDCVNVVFLTDGVGARDVVGSNTTAAEARRNASVTALERLRVNAPIFLDLPDNRLDTVPLLEIVQRIEALTPRFGPEIVYSHHDADLNIDHRLAHQAVLTAFRPAPETSVRAIYCFEVASATEWSFGPAARHFAPQRYVDISDYLQAKLKALDAYGVEMRDFPHVRSAEAVTALATWRGATVGVRAAEAFTVIREIV